MMRAFRLSHSGAGVDGLGIHHEPVPHLRPGEVLVRIRATSLSHCERMILHGDYVLPVVPDAVPLSDDAGEVVAVGRGVEDLHPGDRVAANIFPLWETGRSRSEMVPQLGATLDGMLRDFAVLPATALVQIPAHLSFAEAATLPCVGVTAWNVVNSGRTLTPDDTVLVLGSGGVPSSLSSSPGRPAHVSSPRRAVPRRQRGCGNSASTTRSTAGSNPSGGTAYERRPPGAASILSWTSPGNSTLP